MAAIEVEAASGLKAGRLQSLKRAKKIHSDEIERLFELEEKIENGDYRPVGDQRKQGGVFCLTKKHYNN